MRIARLEGRPDNTRVRHVLKWHPVCPSSSSIRMIDVGVLASIPRVDRSARAPLRIR